MNQLSSTAQAGMLCPSCKVQLSMSERQGVEIDFCPQCRGVWLDRGELDKIIERSEATSYDAKQASPADNGRAVYDEGYRKKGHHGRRKGFLAELFD
ncbi:MAG: hypothetical protein B7Y62_11125 [Sphingomonadales bacterium 35-56-22]|nr:MAG: hypothetical protein B7Y62_11125 [Sphingomonadales bacterium 35-56-22]OYY96307.1 MAG: hypothetical protein B7Y38_11460 [Sphingomonadales bacterium 28-56-43]OYZ59415.1 MAG: hypothetical protein B7Y10_11200 [Sphingomonadales bacterium 24-56-14]OZA81877.1 MAG: hypothetical protein B7X66_11090 [Sphingomonadales bacterium 39-57-19]HQS13550.1 zf-TFIIB domain-containing protein [Sphingorhabdus sp.]